MRIVFNLETVAALVVIALVLGVLLGRFWSRRG
jgi:hypothetical protein